MPTVQRRSKPVNGSVVAFLTVVVAAGVVGVVAALVVAGAGVLFGLLLSFDGNVPAAGAGVVEAGVVAVGVGVVAVGVGVVVVCVVVVGVVGVWP
jgi:hypothetical protein